MSRRARIPIEHSTVLLTGATGGIGRAIAATFAARGARLLLSGRREEPLQRLAAQLSSPPSSRADIRAVVADLAIGEDVRRLGETAVAVGVDVLIANAALPSSGLLPELTEDEIDRMLMVNLRAPVMLAHALAPAMSAAGRGQMVFLSSLAGKVASPASSLYSATKFGLRGFALALREDLRAHGVGVTVISPAFISDAGMYARAQVALPLGAGTRPAQAVVDAVIAAIERNPAELDVAPPALRVGAAIGAVAPGLAAWGSRVMGSQRIAGQFAERQRDSRGP
ncbi:MAG: SDR family NAD(P)-dependent oxidoreductase [Solirubrobacteraceae bacterium]